MNQKSALIVVGLLFYLVASSLAGEQVAINPKYNLPATADSDPPSRTTCEKIKAASSIPAFPIQGHSSGDLEIPRIYLSKNPVKLDELETVTLQIEEVNGCPVSNREILCYLSVDNVITASDYYFGNAYISVGAYATITCDFSFYPQELKDGANQCLTPGIYYVGVRIPEEGEYWWRTGTLEVLEADCTPVILYSEDFEDRVADGWVPEEAFRWCIDWDLGDWAYHLRTKDHASETSSLVTHQFNDFTLELSVRMEENLVYRPVQGFTIAFCCAAGGQWYAVNFYSTHHGTRLIKSYNPVQTYPNPVIVDNQYHQVKIVKEGSKIQAYWDNALVIDYYDPYPYSWGAISIGSYCDPVFFDNILVYLPCNNGGGGEQLIWNEDFEGDFPGFNWESGDLNANSGYDWWDNQASYNGARVVEGYQSCYCADIGDVPGQRYDNDMCAYFKLLSGVNVAHYQDVKLKFSIWFDTEHGVDYAQRYYSCNGYDWKLSQCWSGNSGGWQEYTIKLNNFNYYWIKFEFYSNSWNNYYEGAYVDDIRITGTAVATTEKVQPGQPYEEFDEAAVTDPLQKEEPPTEFSNMNLPKQFALQQNYPNPFNPETSIDFALPHAEFVSLNIYNLNGQLIRTLIHSEIPAGQHSVQWNGKDDAAEEVAGGVYLCVLKAGNFKAHNKMILLK